jgi:hypothetical protein
LAQLNSYSDVQALFNDFVRANGIDLSGSPHQDFWNTLTYDQFVNGDVPGVPGVRILVKGSAANSNLVAILKGPISVPSGTIPQMPEDGPYMSDDMIAALSSWIDRNCPRFAATGRLGSRLSREEQLVQDYFGPNPHQSPRLKEHGDWHHSHNPSQADYGESFLSFHQQYIGRFDQFRQQNGFFPLVSWDPSTEIPADVPHDAILEGPRSTNFPFQVDAACKTPTWLTVAGGSDSDPIYGYNSLCQFRSLDELGRAIDSGWHGTVHNTIGGDMADPHVSPIDPIFFRWHKWIDNIRTAWLACQRNAAPALVAALTAALFGSAHARAAGGEPRAVSTGGAVSPTGGLWRELSRPTRDLLVAQLIKQLASLLGDARAREAVNRALQSLESGAARTT